MKALNWLVFYVSFSLPKFFYMTISKWLAQAIYTADSPYHFVNNNSQVYTVNVIVFLIWTVHEKLLYIAECNLNILQESVNQLENIS